MITFFKRIFGFSKEKNSSYILTKPVSFGNEKDIEAFVRYVVCSLVNDNKAIKINSSYTSTEINVKVLCPSEELGKIVGKKGQTIRTIRHLLNGAGRRFEKKINFEISD